MKKIYSFAFAAVAILSAASCQKEELTNNETLLGEGNFTVTATTEADTKTVLVDDKDGNTIYWTPGDKITLFDVDNKTVSFATDIKENATTATFTNEAEFSAPDALLAIYPAKADAAFDGTTISKLRIAGSQTAVAGSFDPAFAVAVGTENNSGNLYFKNINSLIKFTIGGEKAPATVTFTNGGWRNIAGLFTYNTSDGVITPDVDAGAKSITLKPAAGEVFEVGKTYYIAFVPGGNLAKISLKFDETEVKYVEGPKFADESNGFLINKIIDFGTVAFPDDEPEPEEPAVSATRLWVKTFAELGLSANGARNCATDGEYVFVPNSAASPVSVKAFPVAGGDAIEVNMTGVEGGTHPTSCVRMIPNTDASINGGKDILLLTNLGISTTIYLYAYTNGIENAPERIPLLNTWRRQGDKFTVVGSWQDGELRFPDWNQGANAVVRFPIKDGAIATGQWSAAPSWDPSGKFNVTNGGISEFVTYPGSTDYALVTSTSIGTFNTAAETAYTAAAWTKDPKLAMTFGYNFFELDGAKYIAYARLNDNKANGSLNVIVDKGTAAEFKSTLEEQSKKLTAAVLDADSATTAGSSVCDCDVFVNAGGEAYAAVLIDNCGLAYFKIETAK